MNSLQQKYLMTELDTLRVQSEKLSNVVAEQLGYCDVLTELLTIAQTFDALLDTVKEGKL